MKLGDVVVGKMSQRRGEVIKIADDEIVVRIVSVPRGYVGVSHVCDCLRISKAALTEHWIVE